MLSASKVHNSPYTLRSIHMANSSDIHVQQTRVLASQVLTSELNENK